MGTIETKIDIAFFSLLAPISIFFNIVFFFYWLFNLKWPFLLFIVSFLVGYDEWNLFYKLPNTSIRKSGSTFSVMSYNVRLFNKYKWIANPDIPNEIEKLIIDENPDIICFQEFSKSTAPELKNYKHRYIYPDPSKREKATVAIFSKSKIKSNGFVNFENSSNCGIYIDIEFQNQSIRIYNLHLESFKLGVNDSITNSSFSENFKLKFEEVNVKQLDQVSYFEEVDKSNDKLSIIAVDLNNTQFSKTYKKLSRNKNDAFYIAGSGLGETYNYLFLPLRIDFLLSDKKFKINNFKVIKRKFSDHYPIVSHYGID